MLTVDLTGPSPMCGRLRNADELETIADELARISHTSRLAVVGRATWLAVASGGAIMRRNIGPS